MKTVLKVVLDLVLLPLTLCLGVWVRQRQAQILRDGVALSQAQQRLAVMLGVRQADRVRLHATPRIPLPLPLFARTLAERTGWLSPHIAGMTLGYGIALREDCCRGGVADARLLAHELVHVAQYERLGGINGFLRQYVRECLWPGYPRGALECEAHAAERTCSTREGDVIPYASSVAK